MGAGAEVELWQTLEKIRQICRGKDLPMSRLAIAWVMAQTTVSCVLVGTRNTTELAQNLEGVNYTMPSDLVRKLDRLTLPLLQKKTKQKKKEKKRQGKRQKTKK